MRRLSFLLLAVTAVFHALPSFAQARPQPDPGTILNQEKLFWKSYVAADTTTLDKLFAPDFTNVEQQIWNRGEVLHFVKQFTAHCTLAPVTMRNPKVIFLSPEIATVVYHAIESPTCGGRSMSGDTNITSVWQFKGGNWQMYLHTEDAINP